MFVLTALWAYLAKGDRSAKVPFMHYTLHLILTLSLMLTSIGLGTARGTVQIGGQVVICTGEGLVVRTVPGVPGQSEAHICPDMALSLIDAVVAEDIAAPYTLVSRGADTAPHVPHGDSRLVPAATARDPPKGLTVI